MAAASIAEHAPALAAICRMHRIRRLGLFGSVLRDDFGPDSDIDILVEFEPGHTPGLRFFRIQDELTHVLGRAVDLHTPESLSPKFRDQVLRELDILYEAA